MTIALLATGDELVQGDTLNTNSFQIAHILESEGLGVALHLTCSDNEKQIHDCIKFLACHHDIIIITGGLGPTSDDRTRFALSCFLAEPLVEFTEAQAHLQKRLTNHKLALSSGNLQQTRFPPRAILLPNPHGTAMGCYCTKANLFIVLLPGPPRECIPMFTHHVMPQLKTLRHRDKHLLKWRVFGVAESVIAEQLDNALKDIDCETGYRLETPYIECKVRCHSDLLDTVTTIVEPILLPHIIATPAKKASESFSAAVLQWQQSITIYDEVSGGLLQTLIQSPENHHLLKFHNFQHDDYFFHLQGLREYWTGQKNCQLTALTITYRLGQQEGIEQHELPFRSAMVTHYAAEWLCFRLFKLIDQLH